MKSRFDSLDFESVDELVHDVTTRFAQDHYDKLLDGFWMRFVSMWYDDCDAESARTLLSYAVGHSEEFTRLQDDSIDSFRSSVLNAFFTDLEKLEPKVLKAFPYELPQQSEDEEHPPPSHARYISAFFNEYFLERSKDRAWLDDVASLTLWYPLPALGALDPRVSIVPYLRVDSEEDLKLLERLSELIGESRDVDRYQWQSQVQVELFKAYEPTFWELSLAKQLEMMEFFGKHQFSCLDMRNPTYAQIFRNVCRMDQLPEGLDDAAILRLIRALESGTGETTWTELPEHIRYELFERMPFDQLPEFDPSAKRSEYERLDKSPENPCSWLMRPDWDLYFDAVYEWIAGRPVAEQLEIVSSMQDPYPNQIPERVREKNLSILLGFQEQLMKLPIEMAQRLILDPRLQGSIDQAKGVEVYLGRMRQFARTDCADLPRLFGAANSKLLQRDAMKALGRLLDALIVAEQPIADADLSFSDDLLGFYSLPVNSPFAERVAPEAAGKWLMQKLYEWIFRYLSGACWEAQGMSNSICPEGMDLESIRKFWAEYCWKKLDLKKTSKHKDPSELTPEDYLEPRAAWRIAHLKSLGDLGEDLGNKAHRRIHIISKHDPDEEVRAVAKEVYHKTLRERMKDAENPFYSFIKVTMWFRIANLETLDIDIDQQAAIRNRNRELRLAKTVYEQYIP